MSYKDATYQFNIQLIKKLLKFKNKSHVSCKLDENLLTGNRDSEETAEKEQRARTNKQNIKRH